MVYFIPQVKLNVSHAEGAVGAAVKDYVNEETYSIDWVWVESTINCLEDVATLTTKMQKEVYYMGDFWLDLEFCKFDMDKRMDYVSGEPVADKTNEFVVTMLHHLEKRTKPLLNTPY